MLDTIECLKEDPRFQSLIAVVKVSVMGVLFEPYMCKMVWYVIKTIISCQESDVGLSELYHSFWHKLLNVLFAFLMSHPYYNVEVE